VLYGEVFVEEIALGEEVQDLEVVLVEEGEVGWRVGEE